MKVYTCADCGAKKGEFHSINCDIERCPKCHGQLLSCSCEFPKISPDGLFLIDNKGIEYPRSRVQSLIKDFEAGGVV